MTQKRPLAPVDPRDLAVLEALMGWDTPAAQTPARSPAQPVVQPRIAA